MKRTKTSYETIELTFDDVRALLIKALELDDKYKLSARHFGDTLWGYKFQFALTKTMETK